MIIFNKLLKKNNSNMRYMFYTHMAAVIIFTVLYYLVSIYLTHNNIPNILNSLYDCFYLSIITQSTLGYDNIILEHQSIKNIQILQMITIFILVI
jgi:hypothetical protein